MNGVVRELRALARATARDRYLAALLAPTAVRNDLVAAAAFGGEMARIPFLVSDPVIGEVRYQWWRDVLRAPVTALQTGHPIADAVHGLKQRHGDAQTLLLMELEARALELYAEPFADDEQLAAFADGAGTAPLRLAADILGLADDPKTQEALHHAGRAVAMSDAALRLPRNLAASRLPLPLELFGGEDPRTAPLAARPALLRRGVTALADKARENLEKFRGLQPDLAPCLIVAVLPLALVEPYLHALQNPYLDPSRQVADIAPLWRVIRLWTAHWRQRI